MGSSLLQEKKQDIKKLGKSQTLSSVNLNEGIDKSLSDSMKGKLENHFGYSVDNLKFKESSEVSDMGAHAYTKGNVIKFAPNEFNQNTREGQELIGHEVSHVLQQNSGVMANDSSNINSSSSLESSADLDGAKVASSSFGDSMSSLSPMPTASVSSAPIQMKKMTEEEIAAEKAKVKAEALNGNYINTEIMSEFSNSDFQDIVAADHRRNNGANNDAASLQIALHPQFALDAKVIIQQFFSTPDDLLNPVKRLIVHKARKQAEDGARFGGRDAERKRELDKLEDELERMVVENTLKDTHNEEPYEPASQNSQQRDNARVMLRSLFLMQLSGVKVKTTPQGQNPDRTYDTSGNDYQGPLATTFTRGGRVNFVLPKKISGDKENKKFMAQFYGETAQMRFSTHSTERSDTVGGMKEIKSGFTANMKNIFHKKFKARGVDIGMGGVGTKGINGKAVAADGTHGHMMIASAGSSKEDLGAISIGVETAGVKWHKFGGLKGSTGKVHTAEGSASKFSTAMGQKSDKQGDDVAGRTADLSRSNLPELTKIMV